MAEKTNNSNSNIFGVFPASLCPYTHAISIQGTTYTRREALAFTSQTTLHTFMAPTSEMGEKIKKKRAQAFYTTAMCILRGPLAPDASSSATGEKILISGARKAKMPTARDSFST